MNRHAVADVLRDERAQWAADLPGRDGEVGQAAVDDIAARLAALLPPGQQDQFLLASGTALARDAEAVVDEAFDQRRHDELGGVGGWMNQRI